LFAIQAPELFMVVKAILHFFLFAPLQELQDFVLEVQKEKNTAPGKIWFFLAFSKSYQMLYLECSGFDEINRLG